MNMIYPLVRKLRPVVDRLGFRLAMVLAIALLPLMIVSIIRSESVMKEAEARSQAALAGETLRAVQREVMLIENARGASQTLSSLIPTLLADSEQCSRFMREVLVGTSFSFAGYYTTDGHVPCSSAEAPFNFAMTPQRLAQVANPEPAVLVNRNAPISGTSVIYAAFPVFSASGSLMGFTSISVPHNRMQAGDAVEGPAKFLTLKGDETILTAPGDLDAAKDWLPKLRAFETISDLPASFTRQGRDGQNRIYSVIPIVENELYALGTWVEREEPGAGFYFTDPALFPALMWLASLCVAWFASRLFVTQHVMQLRHAMRSFSARRTQSDPKAFRYAPGELRDVAEEFMGMTDRILHEEARLEDIARQKDILLREVHHRVKNNLQLIASIMSMQMRQSRSPEVQRLIRSLHDRVNSLATVHRDLYQTSGQADVSMDELLRKIVHQVVRMGSQQGEMDLSVDLVTLRLNPDQAVPLSLFVTEALTNALKYLGGTKGKKAKLRVDLTLPGDDEAMIEIANSLPGTIEAPNDDKSSGLGAELMEAFSDQLGGELERFSDADNFVVRLRFTVEPLQVKGGQFEQN